MHDPSPPFVIPGRILSGLKQSSVTAAYDSNNTAFLVTFYQAFDDWESFIKGVNVSLGSYSGGADLHAPTSVVSPSPSMLMVTGLNLPHGTRVYASFDAWNNGLGHAYFVADPVTIDLTPPAPTVACVGGYSQPGRAWRYRSISSVNVSNLAANVVASSPVSCEGVSFQFFTGGFWLNWAQFLDDSSPIGAFMCLILNR